MQIVDVDNMLQRHDMTADLVQIQPFRSELHEHPQGFAHQYICPGYDQHDDQQPRDGISLLEARRRNNNCPTMTPSEPSASLSTSRNAARILKFASRLDAN